MSDPLLSRILNEFYVAVFERLEDRTFRLLSDLCPWLSAFLPFPVATDRIATMPDELTYLGNFLIDADNFWQSGASDIVSSGIWNELLATGESCHLEASALILDGRNILVVRILGIGLTQDQLKEQKAKEDLLAYEDLVRTERDLEKYSIILEKEVSNRTADLKKRIDELHCLYNISRLVDENRDSLPGIFRATTRIIPSGWQYPYITCARLTINSDIYSTDNWMDTAWKMEAPLIQGTNNIGKLEICYLEETPVLDDGPFYHEERNLLNAICELLGRNIKRIKAEQDLLNSYTKISKTFEDTIAAIGNMVQIKDPYTASHQVRVAALAVAIAREMGLDEERLHTIHIAATIHDVGKIYVPSDLLSKPGKLSEIEFEIIKTHVENSYNILKGIEFPWPIARIALQHHERLDGSGYPNNLKGGDIIPEARIIAVADVVEAMMTHRPYRPARGIDAALDEITSRKGICYDPAAVDACTRLFREKGFVLEE